MTDRERESERVEIDFGDLRRERERVEIDFGDLRRERERDTCFCCCTCFRGKYSIWAPFMYDQN